MWQITGQKKIVSLLQKALEKDSLAHAYLFTGPPHVGKMTLALNLARALNCTEEIRPCGACVSCQKITSATHVDIQIIGLSPNANSTEAKLRTEISIDQIRQIQHFSNLPPFEGKYKVFIIDQAEFLSNEAANCLLKTLEEPVGKVVFILLTANDSLLLPTVVSRCQRLELHPLPATEIETALTSQWGIEPDRSRLLARLAHGCMGWAITAALDNNIMAQREEKLNTLLSIIAADYNERFAYAAQQASQFTQNRNSVYHLLDLWLDYWRDLMLVKMGLTDFITNFDRLTTLSRMAGGYRLAQIKNFIQSIRVAEEQLKQNANPRLVLEVLMLDMPGKEIPGEENLAMELSVNNG